MSTKSNLGLGLCLILVLIHHGVASVDYGAALTKSIMYYESQRSGKLPANQRVSWRGDSGLKDGSDAGIDLVGGYYDAGDNVKFGLPMAYTMTMLSWGALDFNFTKLELTDVLTAIRWGTDYLLKAHPQPNVLYGQVGDGDSDHACWQRPEDMTTPRTSFKIDEGNPGSDLAGETSAALAAASLVLTSDTEYRAKLLNHSKQLFDFARNHQGLYQNSIPSAAKFYSSSDFQDELLWAAVWLFRATGEQAYLDFLSQAEDTGGVREVFFWDDKFVGVQVIVAGVRMDIFIENTSPPDASIPTTTRPLTWELTMLILKGTIDDTGGIWSEYQTQAEEFICNCIQKGNNNVQRSQGGLLWWQPWNNLQYTTAAVFIATVYSDSLARWETTMQCQDTYVVEPAELITFAQSQVDYILGSNPKSMSYMVGFGSNYPKQVHHRGASIVSIKNDSTPVTCKGGFDAWFNRNASDPNVLNGAIVGGPDDNDSYTDSRSNYQQAEPAIANSAPLVGVLARLKN